jgi:hypothetical protein
VALETLLSFTISVKYKLSHARQFVDADLIERTTVGAIQITRPTGSAGIVDAVIRGNNSGIK